MFDSFLELERKHAGWRFWVLWVLATNVGFFPGLALGSALSAFLAEPFASAVTGGSFGALSGLAQWLVLRRHRAPSLRWVLDTGLGWCIGAGVGALLLTHLTPAISPGGLVWTLSIGFFAGAVVGVPQRQTLRGLGPGLAEWWIPISSFAWGVFFPGMISGLVLAHRLRSPS